MPSRKVTLTAAAAGAVGGLATLTILAIPTGATAAPELPTITAEQLIDNVVGAEPPAFGGTVEVENGLGLPAVPGLPELANGAHAAQAWSDGDGRGRLSLPDGNGEQTIVDDGETVWKWDSTTKTVTKLSANEAESGQPEVSEADIAAQAKELLAQVSEFSDVSVDGTATVADRPVYELAVTPKPDERTLLREIRISVDSETWLPLRLTVLANNHTDPVIQAGFSQIDVGPQDASLFTFTPPEGATVEEVDPSEVHAPDATAPTEGDLGGKVIGDGWETTLVAQIPTGAAAPSTEDGSYDGGQGPQNPLDLASQFGKPVSGDWGDGWLIETNAANALVTSDGWVAVGAVPEQVLIDALGQAK